jgi:acyl-[acyl carrier protein]--UDP-N-acetylglucosamine O-acyltransferase
MKRRSLARICFKKLNLKQAIEELAEKLPECAERKVILDFVMTSKRGIIR